MVALKTLRADLTAHLASGLDVAGPALGAQVNPPLALVRAGDPYVTAEQGGYCLDSINLEAVVLAPPGDPPAVIDALDDLIDQIRSTLRNASDGGYKYAFQSVSIPGEYTYGDRTYPAVVVTIAASRTTPDA